VSLGWMAGAIAGTAVVFGMASPAVAAPECPDPSYPVYCGYTTCTSDPCSNSYARKYVCRADGGTCTALGNTEACNC
jgi:hypothetical protein